MVGKYGVTEDEVRNYQGLNDVDIGDAPVQDFILQAEEEAERVTSNAWVPRQRIENFEGELGNKIVMLTYSPIAQVKKVRRKEDTDEYTSLEPDNLKIENDTGKIILTEDSAESTWNTSGYERNVIQYTYADMYEDQTAQSDTTSSNSPGNTVVDVGSSSDFNSGDYVKIHGIDGKEEVVEVTDVDAGGSNELTVEELQLSHESGSVVTKMVSPETALDLIKTLASIRVAAYKIGGTQDFQSSYNLGELEVTKGEPYPPFKQLLPHFKNERDQLVKKLKNPVIK